jgi:hypothetical protein
MRLVVLVVALLLGSVGVGHADPRAVDAASAAVKKAETARAAIIIERGVVGKRYDAQLGEVDKLKRQKASWRRDRALRAQMADSLETARMLDAIATRLKKADADVARARAVAVATIEREQTTVRGPRWVQLERLRRQWEPPPPPPRKIFIPDERLDPLADPEELDLQAASLRDTEAELVRELDRLESQVKRFDRMAELRRQHERADELARRDETDPRRIGTVARGGGQEAATAADGEGLTDNPAPQGPGESEPDARDFATALSEVVDPSTVDALRKAERSSDPSARAAVARRARDAVNQRLSTLRKRRAAIEGRARELRTP